MRWAESDLLALTSPHLQQYQLIRGFVSNAGDWVGCVMVASMSVCVDGWIVGLLVGLFVGAELEVELQVEVESVRLGVWSDCSYSQRGNEVLRYRQYEPSPRLFIYRYSF